MPDCLLALANRERTGNGAHVFQINYGVPLSTAFVSLLTSISAGVQGVVCTDQANMAISICISEGAAGRTFRSQLAGTYSYNVRFLRHGNAGHFGIATSAALKDFKSGSPSSIKAPCTQIVHMFRK